MKTALSEVLAGIRKEIREAREKLRGTCKHIEVLSNLCVERGIPMAARDNLPPGAEEFMPLLPPGAIVHGPGGQSRGYGTAPGKQEKTKITRAQKLTGGAEKPGRRGEQPMDPALAAVLYKEGRETTLSSRPKSMSEAPQSSHPAWKGNGMKRPDISLAAPPAALERPKQPAKQGGQKPSCYSFWVNGEGSCSAKSCSKNHEILGHEVTRTAGFQDAQRKGILPLWTSVMLIRAVAAHWSDEQFLARAGNLSRVAMTWAPGAEIGVEMREREGWRKRKRDQAAAPESGQVTTGSWAAQETRSLRLHCMSRTLKKCEDKPLLICIFRQWHEALLGFLGDRAEAARRLELSDKGYGPFGDVLQRMIAGLRGDKKKAAVNPPPVDQSKRGDEKEKEAVEKMDVDEKEGGVPLDWAALNLGKAR